MKSRVLGLACAAGLAAGCQSSAARALSRYQGAKDKSGEIAQTSHEAPAGLPGASKRKDATTPQPRELSFEMGEKSLQQFYRDQKDKPAHLQRARVNFEAAAKADPADPSTQHRLAIVADLQKRFNESESYYLTALSLDPNNANIAADLGWSYILQNRWPDAERALQRALELDPTSSIAREHLATCRQQKSATQVAVTQGPPGQMLANRPAAVGQNPGMAPANWSQPASQEPQRGTPGVTADHMGEYLRNQLAQVDHSGTPRQQALTLGPSQPAAPMQPGQSQQFPGQPVAQSAAPQPQYGGNPYAQGQPYQSPQQSQDLAYADRSQARPSQTPFVHIEPGTSAAQRSTPGNPQTQVPPPYGNVASNAQPQRGPGSEWPMQAGANAIQRTQSIDARGPSDQALYQAPQYPAPPAQPAAPGGYPQQPYQQAPASSVPSTGFTQQQQPQPTQGGQPQAQALEKARRDAALMGLGLGPGQLFPTLEQPVERMTPERMSPGSNSFSSGAAFGTPPIHSPDMTPPPDLRQMPSFFEQGPVTPPTNSMGQNMPGGTSSMMTPGTVNDPNARFQQNFVNPAAGQGPQLPSPPNVWNQSQSTMQAGMQGYDDARRATDQQLQQSLQNAWQGTPSGVIPSPAGGVPMQGVGPQSQMMNDSWGRQPVAPAPYPQAAPPQTSRSFEPAQLPAVNPSISRSAAQADNFPPQGRVSQPQYRDGVVVPEQYGPVRQ